MPNDFRAGVTRLLADQATNNQQQIVVPAHYPSTTNPAGTNPNDYVIGAGTGANANRTVNLTLIGGNGPTQAGGMIAALGGGETGRTQLVEALVATNREVVARQASGTTALPAAEVTKVLSANIDIQRVANRQAGNPALTAEQRDALVTAMTGSPAAEARATALHRAITADRPTDTAIQGAMEAIISATPETGRAALRTATGVPAPTTSLETIPGVSDALSAVGVTGDTGVRNIAAAAQRTIEKGGIA